MDEAVRSFIEKAGLIRTVTDLKPYKEELVFEFWANLPTVKVDTTNVGVLVRNWEYEFSPENINELFGLASVDVRQQRMDMVGLMEDEVAKFLTDGKVKSLKGLLVSAFSPPGRKLFKLCCTNWSPTSNDGMHSLTEPSWYT